MADNEERDEFDFDGDDEEEVDVEEDSGDTPSDDSAATSSKAVEKRISDLQSRADKAEARANKLEKLLAKRDDEGDAGGSKDPERNALLSELREAGLDSIYSQFTELTQYGIDRTLIEGATRAELRASAASLVALIKNIETKARNATLREFGLKADPSGTSRKPPRDYSQLSDEEFEKELAKAKSGGVSLW